MNIQNTLYHYTSNHVLFNIVKNNSLWLGGRWHLNDFHEGEVFNRLLMECAGKINSSKAQGVIAQLDSFDFYVTCMTKNGDALSQWRGYANDGAGICIGFDKDVLIESIKKSTEALLYPVQYSDNLSGLEEKTIIFMEKILSEYESTSLEFLQSATKERWAVKGKGFEEEEEIRLIITPNSPGSTVSFNGGAKAELKYRATDTDIRDFYEMSFAPDVMKKLIRSITLGPKNKSNESTVVNFLKSYGFNDVILEKSKMTYR